MLFLHDASLPLESLATIALGIAFIDLKQDSLTVGLAIPRTIHKSRGGYNQIRTISH